MAKSFPKYSRAQEWERSLSKEPKLGEFVFHLLHSTQDSINLFNHVKNIHSYLVKLRIQRFLLNLCLVLGLFSHVRFQPTGGNRKQLKIQVQEQWEFISLKSEFLG